jgi:2-oxoisovalerate dehydrogenase E1 component
VDLIELFEGRYPKMLARRDIDDAFTLYVRCSFIRRFERKLLDLFAQGKLSGTTHTGIGQEANAVGMAAACRADDVFVSNHRCHAHVLAHVGAPERLLAEVMGGGDGFCGGLGGSQHICVPGRFFSNGIQGGTLPLAAGLALAAKRSGSQNLVCVFMGDGTTGEGSVYEALNLAACNALPLVVVVEDNEIAQTTPTAGTIGGSIRARFEAFGFAVSEADCPTADELLAIARPVVDRARGGVPSAIVVKSARLGPHSKGDDTRPADVIAAWQDRDPMKRMAESLRAAGRLDEAEAAVDAMIAELPVDRPVVPAPLRMANYPAAALDSADLAELDGTSFLERLNRQIASHLAEVPGAVLIGEDIGDPYGGAFKVSKGLQTRFPDKVIQTPISEAGFTGLAAGAAVAGMRPIIEMMFGDFTLLAFDQIINHAAKYPLMYDGQVACPLVVRVPMGGGRGYGPTHSQSLEKHLCGVPNLQVIALSPYTPTRPVFDMLRRADGPTVLVEHKADYGRRADRRQLARDFALEICGTAVRYTPPDGTAARVVVLAYGGQVATALEVAQKLSAEHGLSAEVTAVTRLHPLATDDLFGSRTTAPEIVVTIEESSIGWGFGSEVAASVLEGRRFATPPRFLRIGALDTIVPAGRVLEKEMLPDAARIVQAIASALKPTAAASPIAEAAAAPEKVETTAEAVPGIEVQAPQLNANDDELKVVEVLVADGAEVAAGTPILTVETSKAAEEVETPVAGFVRARCAVDDIVRIGEVLAVVYPTRAAWEAAAAVSAPTAAAPAAKVDVPQVVSAPVETQRRLPPGATVVTPSKVQRAMQKTLQISRDEIVPAHLFAECRLARPAQKKIDLLDVAIHHAARLIARHPDCNAYRDGQTIVRHAGVDFGFTTDVDGDLYMGVVKNAESLTVEQIAAERMNLILSMFRGEIDQAMLAEPSICITALNGRHFTHQIPVVYPRTSLIIGFNQRPTEGDAVAASLTFAYDHQVVSGFEISRFADELIDALV